MAEKSSFCYSYLGYHSKFNTFVGLPFFVKRDFYTANRFSLWWSYLYQYISELWMFLGFISGVAALFSVWNDVNVLFGCISSTSHLAAISFKVLLFKWKRRRFLEHLNSMNSVFERNELLKTSENIPHFTQYASESLRCIRILESILVGITALWTSIYFMPYMYNSIFHHEMVHQQNIPIVGFIPFDYTRTPLFQLVVIFQTVCFYMNNIKTVIVDYFVVGFISLHVVQFRYLNLALQTTIDIMMNEASDGKMERKHSLGLDSFLLAWIRQHQETIRAVRTSKELLSEYFLVEFAYIIIHTCVPAFVITSTLSWTLNQKTALIFFATSGIITLYLMSVNSDNLNDSGEELCVTIYGSHLYDDKLPLTYTFQMLLYIGRYKSLTFGFSNVFPLCSVTFSAILRMVMSYYLALNQIKAILG